MNTSAMLSRPQLPESRGPEGQLLGRRLVANTAANFLGQGAVLVIGFLSTPYIVTHLGPSLYGALILLFAYIDAFALLDFGINVALIKYLSEFIPVRRTKEISAYFGTALTLLISAGALISLAVVVSASWLADYALGASSDLHKTVVAGFSIASAAFFVRFVGQAFAAVPIATQRFDLANCVTAGSETLRASGSVVAIYLGYGLLGVVVISLCVNGLAFAANLLLARRLLPAASFLPTFSSVHFAAFFHFSKFLVISNISGRLVHSLDKVILSHLVSVAPVGFYGVAYGLAQKLWLLGGSVLVVVLPAASALTSTPSRHQLRELYIRSSKFVAAATAFPAFTLWLCRRELLRFWLGPEFALHSAHALGFLAWGFFINSLGHVPVVISQAIGRPHVGARFAMLNASISIALLALLTPYLGIEGAAISFTATQLLLTPWLTQTANHSIGIAYRSLVTRAYVPVAVACLAGGLAESLALPAAVSLTSLFVVITIGTTIYSFTALILILDHEDRVACWSLLRARFAPTTPSPPIT